MRIYIYALICPLTGETRYIGKTINPAFRDRAHYCERNKRSSHKQRWILKLANLGLRPKLEILREVSADEKWQDIERLMIADAIARGENLTNQTAGGEGLDFIHLGDREAYIKKLSASMAELWNRPERKCEARERSVKAWSDPEIRARCIASLKRAQARPELKARLAVAKSEVNSRPAVKSAKSMKSKAAWCDPGYRAARVSEMKDPERLEQQSQRLKARWCDISARAKMQASRWSEEKRAAQAGLIRNPERQAKIKAKLSDPELIKRRNASIKASWHKRRAAKA